MQQSNINIGRMIGMLLLAFYTLAIQPLALLQLQWAAIPTPKKEEAVSFDNSATSNSSHKEEKRTVVGEASDLEAIISSGVQCIVPKWHLSAPLLFLLPTTGNLPEPKPFRQVILPPYVEALFETLILPNAP
ncbi:MAG: hypothetical protein RMJ87_13050 [Cytophagales bacterium]|nr:hypothetical protein [Bernardetiaceae bacterium]MDW8205949.1 hypothetical protein [Cytophagales bacterium]